MSEHYDDDDGGIADIRVEAVKVWNAREAELATLRIQLADAQAERDRYREALGRISSIGNEKTRGNINVYFSSRCQDAVVIARTALTQKEP